ncbi:hypothetical protein Nepgr_008209 [Nepenthes gracilis]|uniref:Uncharacterized protein n=1 Tax=Nepenthes gracilis TaxID=150966 RepID=A0AAD3S8N2_NEPGR|nr:hypothetical protein Nepgr_008209 [Nepenthes gracilis]
MEVVMLRWISSLRVLHRFWPLDKIFFSDLYQNIGSDVIQRSQVYGPELLASRWLGLGQLPSGIVAAPILPLFLCRKRARLIGLFQELYLVGFFSRYVGPGNLFCLSKGLQEPVESDLGISLHSERVTLAHGSLLRVLEAQYGVKVIEVIHRIGALIVRKIGASYSPVRLLAEWSLSGVTSFAGMLACALVFIILVDDADSGEVVDRPFISTPTNGVNDAS